MRVFAAFYSVLFSSALAWANTSSTADCAVPFAHLVGRPSNLERALFEAQSVGLTATRIAPTEHRIPLKRVKEAVKNHRPNVAQLQKRLADARARQVEAQKAELRAEAKYSEALTKPVAIGIGSKDNVAEETLLNDYLKALNARSEAYAAVSEIELAIRQAELPPHGSPHAFEEKKYQLTSPEIARLQRDGVIKDVILLDRIVSEGSLKIGGQFIPDTRDVRLSPTNIEHVFGIEVEGASVSLKLRHELVHAMAYAKSPALTRSSATGELRGHPFLFSSTTRTPDPKWPYSYHHASEVTAYRAGAVAAEKEGKVNIALDDFEKSNRAIERNLAALEGVRKQVAEESYQQGMHHSKVRGKDVLVFLFGETGAPMRVELPFVYRGEQDIYSQKELLEYLEFLKRANTIIKDANDKDLQRLQDPVPRPKN